MSALSSKDIVYDGDTGVQKCLHRDVCTNEFLAWEKRRFEDLTMHVAPTVPRSKLPLYESVPSLRLECCRRCDTEDERKYVNKLKS
jgi:hypothetical protein